MRQVDHGTRIETDERSDENGDEGRPGELPWCLEASLVQRGEQCTEGKGAEQRC